MAVVFTKNLTAISLQNPKRSNAYNLKKHQAMGRTASGNLYTYDKGVDIKKLVLEFEELRQSEKDNLESFYNTTVDGIMNTFSLADHQGNTWTARFLNTELEFEEIDNVGKTGTTFISGGISYPSTTWDEGIYNTKIELEVTAA